MDILTDESLLKQIETFIARHKIAPTRFGRDVMGDGALIQHLKEGRSVSLRNAQKIVSFMATYRADAQPLARAS